MEYEHNAYVLTGIIVLLTLSWGASYWQDKKSYLSTHIDIAGTTITSNFKGLSKQQVYDLIGPSLYSGNISLIAKTLSQFQPQQAHALLEYIITQEEQVLSNQELVMLVVGIANYYPLKKDRHLFFNILEEHPDIYSDIPALYTIAQSQYKSLISEVVAWMKEKEIVDTHVYDAYAYAIAQKNNEVFQVFLAQRILPSQLQANKLLVEVVKQKSFAQFISLLVQECSADPNYSPDGKKTVLMYAVETNIPSLVRALLKEGADKNVLLDVATGTALQIAILQSKTEAEMVLRELGAQE